MANRSGSPYSLPRDANHVPAVGGVKASDGVTVQPLEVDANNNLLVNVNAGAGALVSALFNNQQTATTSAVALASQALTQGIIIEALSTNTVSVFVGNSGVTTSNGIELPAGSSVILPVNNSNLVYIICASSSPVVSWVAA